MNIHILYLIRRHDCVIVPGFGAFITERIPSRIDSETLTVFAPEIRIGFNSELTADDGILIHSVARRNRVSYQDARRVVEHSVGSFNQRLDEGGIVELKGIGTIRLTDEGKKLFTPEPLHTTPACALPLTVKDDVLNPSADTSSNRPLTMREAALEHFAEGSAAPMSKSGSESGVEGCTEKQAATQREVGSNIAGQVENAGAEEEGQALRKSTTLLNGRLFMTRIACAVAIVIATVLGFGLSGSRPMTEAQEASIVPVETLINITKGHVKTEGLKPASAPEQQKTTQAEETAVAPKTEEAAKTEVAKMETMKFHLIVGTFNTLEEAERFIAMAEDDTTNLTPVSGRGGKWRVAAASSDDRESLRSQLNSLQDRYPGGWIWERR